MNFAAQLLKDLAPESNKVSPTQVLAYLLESEDSAVKHMERFVDTVKSIASSSKVEVLDDLDRIKLMIILDKEIKLLKTKDTVLRRLLGESSSEIDKIINSTTHSTSDLPPRFQSMYKEALKSYCKILLSLKTKDRNLKIRKFIEPFLNLEFKSKR